MHWEARFEATAEAHEGLVAKFQLLEMGLDSVHWWRAVRTGRWHPVGDRVLRSAGSPATEAQRVLAAVLDASRGPYCTGRPLWPGSACGVTNSATSTWPAPATCRDRRPPLRHCTSCGPFGPTTWWWSVASSPKPPLRAIWTEAARYAGPRRHEFGLERIGSLLDQAHRLGLVTWAGLHEMVDDIRMRGRSGTVLMRVLAGERPPGSSPTDSRLEDQFEKVLADHGARAMRRQRWLGGHEPIGRCDFSDEDVPLAAEVNSLTFHTTPTDRAADERRYQALMDAGFTVCVIWEDDLWSRQHAVATTVAKARAHAAPVVASSSIRRAAPGPSHTSAPRRRPEAGMSPFWWQQRVPENTWLPPERRSQG